VTEIVVDDAVLAGVDASRPDLDLIDALARLQLEVGRRGGRMLLRDVPEELGGLLELVGLAGVLGAEPRREAELAEEGRVEEMVQPRDPPA
jgi:hypothetical protein